MRGRLRRPTCSPRLLHEAHLRRWKSHAVVGLLLESAGSAMKSEDTETMLARVEALYAVTYEQRADPSAVSRAPNRSNSIRSAVRGPA